MINLGLIINRLISKEKSISLEMRIRIFIWQKKECFRGITLLILHAYIYDKMKWKLLNQEAEKTVMAMQLQQLKKSKNWKEQWINKSTAIRCYSSKEAKPISRAISKFSFMPFINDTFTCLNLPRFNITTHCYCNILQESYCLQVVQQLVGFSNASLLSH